MKDDEKIIIARREKRFLPLFLIFFAILTALSVYLLVSDGSSGLAITGIIIGGAGALIFAYFVLSPKNAVVICKEKISVRYLFKKKTFPLSDLKYAAAKEKGEWYHRTDSAYGFYRFLKDIRPVTLTFDAGHGLKHYTVWVKDGKSVEAALNAVAEKEHDNK